MSPISTSSALAPFDESDKMHVYQIEVITFDGESKIFYIEAYNGYEAQEKAAAMVSDADYTMVQSIV